MQHIINLKFCPNPYSLLTAVPITQIGENTKKFTCSSYEKQEAGLFKPFTLQIKSQAVTADNHST